MSLVSEFTLAVYAIRWYYGDKLGGAKLQVKISFLGAARNVTGSQYLLETDNVRLLIDCGLYQERDFRGRNWEPFRPLKSLS